ncbi:MAG: hypothetical protein JW741_21080 [Sedimentisphaerales bacterium]|nr:hypothetical protein [Sedimentisphaerales bacterium]
MNKVRKIQESIGEFGMQKQELFARIGELTVQFATLEHQLQSLLKRLLREDCPLLGPFFIHELNLAVLLRKIKHIARYRLQDDEPLCREFEQTVKRIDAMRDLRNLLVHGYWEIDETCSACPVRVRDFKMKQEGGQWQDLTETTFTERKLTHLVERLREISAEVDGLVARLQERQARAAE